MKRVVLFGGLALVVIVVAVGYGLYSSLDGIIKNAVETYGSEATRADVTLDGVDLDLGSGKGALRGFTVGNPQGFSTPSAFRLGGVSVAVDTASVTQDPVVIKEIAVDGPEVTYELGEGGSNVDALKRNVDAYVKKMGGGASSSESSGGGEGPKLVIENLWVRGGKANVSASILQGQSLSAALPDIHLTDIGKDKGGATPAEVAKKVMDALNASVTKAMSSIGVGKTLDSLKGKLGDAAGAATKAAEDLKKQGESAGSGLTEGVGKAGGSMKKMFGN